MLHIRPQVDGIIALPQILGTFLIALIESVCIFCNIFCFTFMKSFILVKWFTSARGRGCKILVHVHVLSE